jgi:hypothetical protein
MTKPPERGKANNPSGKPAVKSDTYTQVPDKESENVKGGVLQDPLIRTGRKATLDPTDTNGCCGG